MIIKIIPFSGSIFGTLKETVWGCFPAWSLKGWFSDLRLRKVSFESRQAKFDGSSGQMSAAYGVLVELRGPQTLNTKET